MFSLVRSPRGMREKACSNGHRTPQAFVLGVLTWSSETNRQSSSLSQLTPSPLARFLHRSFFDDLSERSSSSMPLGDRFILSLHVHSAFSSLCDGDDDLGQCCDRGPRGSARRPESSNRGATQACSNNRLSNRHRTASGHGASISRHQRSSLQL